MVITTSRVSLVLELLNSSTSRGFLTVFTAPLQVLHPLRHPVLFDACALRRVHRGDRLGLHDRGRGESGGQDQFLLLFSGKDYLALESV